MAEVTTTKRFSSFNPVVTFDQYTRVIGGDALDSLGYGGVLRGLPRYVPGEHQRRLTAYRVLDKYYNNCDDLPEAQDEMTPVRTGETAYALQILRDMCVGGNQRIQVPGGDLDPKSPAGKEQQALADWAKRNKFFPKLQANEEKACLYGDAFYRLRWGKTQGKKDVKIDNIDPFYCYPDYDKDDELVAMTLMWEEFIDVQGTKTLCLYKDYYEIKNGRTYETAGWYLMSSTPVWDDLKITKFDTTADGTEINNLDTGLPFIPVFHLPNFYTESNFGISDLTFFVDAIKAFNAGETDLNASAGLAGIPALVLSGLKNRVGANGSADEPSISSGAIFNVDANGGKAEYLDNSKMHTVLIAYCDRMLERFFRNMRLGKLFSGGTDNIRDIESSKAFKTLMASLYARIAQKRTVRDTFYQGLIQALIGMLAKLEGDAAYPAKEGSIEFGSILPSDNSDELKTVGELWAQGKGPISAETAARMAKAAGSGVADIGAEAAAILDQVKPPPPAKTGFGLAKK